MSKSWVLAAAGGLAAVMLLFGGFTLTWWSHTEAGLEVQVGLREAAMCRIEPGAGGCTTVTLPRLVAEPDLLWARAGLGAYAAAWMAAILGLTVAVMAGTGKRAPVMARTALVAAASAVAAGVAFVAWAPREVARGPGVGMILYFAGAALTVLVVILVLRRSNRA